MCVAFNLINAAQERQNSPFQGLTPPEFGQFDAAIVAMLSIFARRAREPLVSLNPELNFLEASEVTTVCMNGHHRRRDAPCPSPHHVLRPRLFDKT
jgi:hypothetical protein